MARQDTSDFLAAFGVGTVLGIGAALLLRPEPRSPRERLLRELKPYRKKLKKSAARVGRELRETAFSGADATGDAIHAGRELLSEFREEVRRIIDEAREELREAMEDHALDIARGRAALFGDEDTEGVDRDEHDLDGEDFDDDDDLEDEDDLDDDEDEFDEEDDVDGDDEDEPEER